MVGRKFSVDEWKLYFSGEKYRNDTWKGEHEHHRQYGKPAHFPHPYRLGVRVGRLKFVLFVLAGFGCGPPEH
jgi:hypothetical protein